MHLASCIPELVDCLVTSVALHKNLFLIAMFLLLRSVKNFGTPVRNCALVIYESKILFRRCSVLPTLELLWSEIVQPELPIYGSSCIDAVSTDVNHFISLGEPDRRGNDSCRVFILYMHIIYLHELVLIAKWLTGGMIIFADG